MTEPGEFERGGELSPDLPGAGPGSGEFERGGELSGSLTGGDIIPLSVIRPRVARPIDSWPGHLSGRVFRRGPVGAAPVVFVQPGDGVFTARGYTTTGIEGDRGAALGILEIPAHEPAYDLPYLGTGLLRDSIVRGPLYIPENMSATLALGKLWHGLGANVKHLPSRVVLAPPLHPDQLRGRTTRRGGVAPNFVPTHIGIAKHRIASPIQPHPSQLLGHVDRRDGVAENVDLAVFFRGRGRIARPIQPHPSQLLGHVDRRDGVSENITHNPVAIMRARVARPIPPHPSQLLGRVDRREGVAPNFFPGPVAIKRGRIADPVQPHPSQLAGHVVRRGPSLSNRTARELALIQQLYARGESEASFLVGLDAFALEGYRMIARNLATGMETVLGFGTQVLAFPLPDGDYSIRLEVDGRYWRGARFATEYPLKIVDKEIVTALPEVRGLAYTLSGDSLFVSWVWEDQAGTDTPEDWALWVDDVDPVDTSGAPPYAAVAVGLGTYSVEVAGGASVLFVAVCARRGSSRGPVATIAIAPPESTIDSPENQSGREPDGGWEP